MPLINLPEYRPDDTTANSNYTDMVVNVFPNDFSYSPIPDLAPLSSTIEGETILNIVAFRTASGIYIIAGTATHLYRYEGASSQWIDIGRSGTDYSANIDAPWSFAMFRGDIIAVNANDDPQILKIGTSTRFAKLGGNPPRAGMVKVWGEFLALMRLPSNPNRVHWSGAGQAEEWGAGSSGSDYQDFADGEIVMGSSESSNPFIFLQSAIYSGTFIPGSSEVFIFQKVHHNIGAKNSESIVSRGENIFFLSDSGFKQISVEGQLLPIGAGRVDHTIFTAHGNGNLENSIGAIDPSADRVYWTIPNESNDNITYVYDWRLGKWTTIQRAIKILFSIFTFGYTLEQLDTVSTVLDELPASLDSKLWDANAPTLGAVLVDNSVSTLSAAPMEAIIGSQLVGSSDETVLFLERTHINIDTDQALLSIGTQLNITREHNLNYQEERQISLYTNAYHCRVRGRVFRFIIRIPEGVQWRHFRGLDAKFKQSGRR